MVGLVVPSPLRLQAWEFVSAATPDEQGGLALTWKWVVAIGVVVGLFAGLQQLISALRRRRLRGAEMRVLELAARQLDAEELAEQVEAARRDAAELARVRSTLLDEVQRRVPEQARLVYLENRRSQLAAALRDLYDEYESVRREAETLMAAGDPVSAELRNSIKSLIEEDMKLRSRVDRLVVGLLGIVVFLLVTPVSPVAMIYGYFETVFVPDQFPVSIVAVTIALASLFCALVWLGLFAVAKHLARSSRGSFRAPSRKTVVLSLVGAGGLALLALAVGALGLHMTISNIQDVAHQFRGAYNCDDYPGQCSFLVSEPLLQRTRGIAGAGFVASTVLVGLLIAAASEWRSHRRLHR